MNKNEEIILFINKHGLACGGNMAGMLMASIQKGLPEVFEKLEDRNYSFKELFDLIEENL